MGVELKSGWQEVQVELLKSLHGYEFKDINDDTGYVDYIAESKSDKKKLLRVIVDPNQYASKADVRTVEYTIRELADEIYDEATLIADGFTSTSERLVRKEDSLFMISPKESFHSTIEVYEAIQRLVECLCKNKCGNLPKTEKSCL